MNTAYFLPPMPAVEARDLLNPIFENWADGLICKYTAYGQAFDLVDAGKVRLIDVMDAAHLIGIPPSVVQMRRSYLLNMSVEPPEDIWHQTSNHQQPKDQQ